MFLPCHVPDISMHNSKSGLCNVFISESPTCDVGTRPRIWAICFPPSCCPIKLIGDLVIFPVAQVFVIEVTVAIFVKETEKGTT